MVFAGQLSEVTKTNASEQVNGKGIELNKLNSK